MATSPTPNIQKTPQRWESSPPIFSRELDERTSLISDYLHQIQRGLSKKIKRSYFFIDGQQPYDEHFQQIFKACFVQTRGVVGVVADASDALKNTFQYFPDVCHRSETRFHYDEDTGVTPLLVHRATNPELIEKLRSIFDKAKGLQQELLQLLEQEGKKLHPNLKADDLDCFLKSSVESLRHDYMFSLYPAAMVFSTVIPKCSDVFKEILSKLLQVAWLEEQLGQIKLPPKPIAQTQEILSIGGVDYIVKKTCDDGACALHALLGEPIDGKYRYSGPSTVRELFAEHLEKEMSKSPTVRTAVANILFSHLDTLDPSSQLLFSGKVGQALKIANHLLTAPFDQFIQSANQSEARIWQQQIDKPQVREKLLAAAKPLPRYRGMRKTAILKAFEEFPELILSLVNESPHDFLQLLAPSDYWQIVNIRSERTECLKARAIHRKLFALNQLYPHYLKAIQDPRYFFNTQELELAAVLFGKKMVVIQSFGGQIIPATQMVNKKKVGKPTVIYHEGIHFSRCKPLERADEQEILYQEAQVQAQELVEWDKQVSQHYTNLLKDEASQLAISGVVAGAFRSSLPIYGQVIRSLINIFGAKIDPFNEKKSIQVMKLIGNSAGSYVLGAPPMQIGKALAIDAWVTLTGPQSMTPIKQAQKSYTISILKSVGGDNKEVFRSFISGVTSAAATFLTLEEKEGEGWVRRIIRNIPRNSDIHQTLLEGVMQALQSPTQAPSAEETHETCDKERETIAQKMEKLKEIEEVIATGTQHIRNLQAQSQNSDEALQALHQANERQSELLQELKSFYPELDLVDPTVGPIDTSPQSQEPLVNPEVERHAEIIAAQLTTARNILIEKEAGVIEAKKKVDEKFAKYQKVSRSRKSKPQDIKKAEKSLSRAHENLRNFENERDDQKTLKVEFFERKLESLQEKLHSSVEEQHYLDRVVDERAYWKQTEQQRLDGIVNEKAVAAAKSKKTMEQKFKEYDKTIFWDEKEFRAYWKARETYKRDANELNIARVNSGLPPEPAFERKAPPKKGPIEKAFDKTERFLTRIGFSGEVSTHPIPLYTTEPPKTTPSYIPDYGPTLSIEPTYHPINAPSPIAQPHPTPTFQNPFIPLAPGTLPPVSIPALPQPSPTVVSASPPKITFGERFQGTIRNLFDHGFPNSIPLKPRTQVMIFPQEPSTPQNPLPRFTPDLQARYPEAYALARNIDQFGRERVTLFRLTLEKHQKPHLFQELDALPKLLEKATGHMLHTSDLTPEKQTPLSLRVEALAAATIDLARDYHHHRMNHPIQSQLDIVLAAPRVVGSWAKDAFKLINFLIKLKNPEDPIAREMGTRTDHLAATIDTFYVKTIQQISPAYDPNSPSSRLGEIAWQIAPIGRAATASHMPLRSSTTTIPRGLATSERLALQSQRTLQKQSMALERLTQPALRSGFVSDRTVQKASKSVNMPSWKKVDIWMDHISSGHKGGGWRNGCKGNKKSLFPEGMTEQQIEKAIRYAYKNGQKFKKQSSKTIVVRGEYQGLKIEMYVDTEKKIITTAYPKQWTD